MKKTYNGSASFIMVMFFTILVGILTVGFISIMLNNLLQTTNYDLSEAAYDSAMAGIEDAKVMLIKYYNCVTHGGSASGGDSDSLGCRNLTTYLDGDTYKDNCNVVGLALGRIEAGSSDTNVETPIKTQYGDGGHSNINDTSNTLDQAYTCVKVQTQVNEYIGHVTSGSNSKVVPIRTTLSADSTTKSVVKYVEIRWFNNDDLAKAIQNGYGDDRSANGLKSDLTVKTTSSTLADSDGKRYGSAGSNSTYSTNVSGAKEFVPPILQVGLVQAPVTEFYMSDFGTNIEANTNHGMLTLRPTLISSTDDISKLFSSPRVIRNINEDGSKIETKDGRYTYSGFAGSAIASNFKNVGGNTNSLVPQNSPYDISCSISALDTYEYACVAKIELPGAIGKGQKQDPSDISRFLTISTPYSDVETTYSIRLYSETDGQQNLVQFAGVQTKVDSTGRANDLFRRVEARIEMQDTTFPQPIDALSVYCDSNNCDSSTIIKNAWISYNCFALNAGTPANCGTSWEGGNQNYVKATTGFGD